MKVKTITAKVYGESSVFDVIQYSHEDIPSLKESFNRWRAFKEDANRNHGRSPNFPEYISEACLCLVTGFVRFKSSKKLKSSSFDCFDLVNERAIQSKACSVVQDLTSFGPKTQWDDLYFLDFYNGGNVDGTFNVYKVPNELIYDCAVKSGRTLKQAQGEGKRPRLSLKDQIIGSHGLKPVDFTESSDIMEHVIRPAGIKPAQNGIKLW